MPIGTIWKGADHPDVGGEASEGPKLKCHSQRIFVHKIKSNQSFLYIDDVHKLAM